MKTFYMSVSSFINVTDHDDDDDNSTRNSNCEKVEMNVHYL